MVYKYLKRYVQTIQVYLRWIFTVKNAKGKIVVEERFAEINDVIVDVEDVTIRNVTKQNVTNINVKNINVIL